MNITQQIRHARDLGEDPPESLTKEHVEALRNLDYHPALFALTDEAISRAEIGIAARAAAERDRATEYWMQLDEQERARRLGIDYHDAYAWETKDGRCGVQECPVCWADALVAEDFDSYLGEVGVGTCIACSYSRSRDMADDQAMGIQLHRLAEQDD